MSAESKEYLDRNLEKPSLSVEEEASVRNAHTVLFQPLGKVEYTEKGSVDLESDNFHLSFSYSPLEVKAIHNLNQEFLSVMGLDPEKLRLLEDFVFTNQKEGKTINLREILPSGYKVVFIPKDGSIFGGAADTEFKTICIWGDLTRPKNILNLFHEVGHCVDYEGLDTSGKKDFVDAYKSERENNLDEKKLETILKRERNAWAFVLKIMKPLFDTDRIKKEDAINFIHNSALSHYSGVIRQRIKEGLKED